MGMAEKEIKIKVINYLINKKLHDVVVPEVTVGNKLLTSLHARADIFAVNGDISIYEIKSEKDNLNRLENQLKLYKQFANRVSVVVDEKFLSKLNIDDSVGIYVVKGKGITLVKEATYRALEIDDLANYWVSQELDAFLFGCKGLSKLKKSEKLEYLKELLTKEQFYYATLYILKCRYQDESEVIKDTREFKKRGMNINSRITPLRKLAMSVLMP